MRLVGSRSAILVFLLLGACVEAPAPTSHPRADTSAAPGRMPQADAGPQLAPRDAAHNFITVLNRMEPVIEAECRQRAPRSNCDYQIVVDERLDLPPNAAQTLDRNGRPIIVFTLALITEARNTDELAFIMGHEASHHILGHLPRQAQGASLGGTLAGSLASALGADSSTAEALANVGATIGSRAYSKDMELEADQLGTVLAWDAGYDPDRGAAFFMRIPDPGNEFLGSHPPNARRIAIIRRTVADLRAGGSGV